MILLASRSPRRLQLLEEHGVPCRTIESGIDDAQLSPPPVSPEHWTMALAYLKARAAWDRSGGVQPGATVLGADTVVAKGERIIGQPRDAQDAWRIISALRGGSHRVVTGVALLASGGGAGSGGPRRIFVDVATVTVGPVPDESIAAYIDSGQWRGKAGGYNLFERTRAGWPLSVEGDPTTVVGLPMGLLLRMLGPQAVRTPTVGVHGGTTVPQ